jgi:nucleotide-binding universal stress UspA family protein
MDFTDHVVVGVDGSSTSIAAAVWARDIARAGHWPLGIVLNRTRFCAAVMRVAPLG